MHRFMKLTRVAALLALCLPLVAMAQSLSLRTGQNLVFNGAFDDPDDPLNGWLRDFNLPGEGQYADNARFVSTVGDSLRGNVLRLDVPGSRSSPGVKVLSRPIPFDHQGQYRFRVRARGTGVPARILLMGYRWAPGVTPHDHPTREDLRETYRFKPLHFRRGGTGGVAEAPRSWQWAEMTFPEPDLSERAVRHLSQVEFVMVQLMGIKGTGELFIDEVVLERLQ